MISKNIASFLSFVFGPVVWLPLLLVVFMMKTGLTDNQTRILFPVLFIFQVCVPLFYIVIAYKLGKVTDLDLTKRQERTTPFIIAFFSLIISLIVVKLFGSLLLFHFYSLFTILLVINGIITLYWKISLHMAITVTGSLIINFLYHWQFPQLFLSIPLVYWSRFSLKKHTKSQLIVAFLLNGSIVFLFFYFISLVP